VPVHFAGRHLGPAGCHEDAARCQAVQSSGQGLHGQVVRLGQAVGAAGHRPVGVGQGHEHHVVVGRILLQEGARRGEHQAHARVGVNVGLRCCGSHRLHDEGILHHSRDALGSSGQRLEHAQPSARAEHQGRCARPQGKSRPLGQERGHLERLGSGESDRLRGIRVEEEAVGGKEPL